MFPLRRFYHVKNIVCQFFLSLSLTCNCICCLLVVHLVTCDIFGNKNFVIVWLVIFVIYILLIILVISILLFFVSCKCLNIVSCNILYQVVKFYLVILHCNIQSATCGIWSWLNILYIRYIVSWYMFCGLRVVNWAYLCKLFSHNNHVNS